MLILELASLHQSPAGPALKLNGLGTEAEAAAVDSADMAQVGWLMVEVELLQYAVLSVSE